MINLLNSGITTLIFVCIIFSFSDSICQVPWLAPTNVDTLENPYVGNAKSIKAGKKLFSKLCSICHGNKGRGDGIAGITLNPKPTDLTKEIVQQQSDGAIYWKITEGRSPMVSYKEALSDQQRWELVCYIKSIAKKK